MKRCMLRGRYHYLLDTASAIYVKDIRMKEFVTYVVYEGICHIRSLIAGITQ